MFNVEICSLLQYTDGKNMFLLLTTTILNQMERVYTYLKIQ